MANLSDTDKAAIGFMDHAMGESPSSDELRGMSGAIDDYADRAGVDSDQLRSSLQKMLPSTSQHPDYQVDSASGAVSGAEGQKVYGEQRRVRITKEQIRKIVAEKNWEQKMRITKSRLRRIIRETMYGEDYLSSTDPDGSGELEDPRLDFASESDDDFEEKHRRAHAHDQGYDDREDERLGMEHGPESGDEQSYHGRRDDARGVWGRRAQHENRVTERRIRQIIRRVTRRG